MTSAAACAVVHRSWYGPRFASQDSPPVFVVSTTPPSSPTDNVRKSRNTTNERKAASPLVMQSDEGVP
jgi:hypothetical protein